MGECEALTCHNEATKIWQGRRVCDQHYKRSFDECEEPTCHNAAVKLWQGMQVCGFHYKQYQEIVDKVRREWFP